MQPKIQEKLYTGEPTIGQKAFEIKRRMFDVWEKKITLLYKIEKTDDGNQMDNFINSVKQAVLEMIPEISEKIDSEMLPLRNISDTSNVGTIVSQTIDVLSVILAKYRTLPEVEAMSHMSAEKLFKGRLSRGLYYDLETNNAISIHIALTFPNNAEEAMELFGEGMRNLAKIILTNPELRNVQRIEGTSALVKDKPRLIQKLGFQITKTSDNKYSDCASMTREKLLELYGENE
jgi:hypothetical protein